MALRFAICFIEPAIAFPVLQHRRQITNPGSLYERTTQTCNDIDRNKSTFRAVFNYPTNFRCRCSKKSDSPKCNEHALSHPSPNITARCRPDRKNRGQHTTKRADRCKRRHFAHTIRTIYKNLPGNIHQPTQQASQHSNELSIQYKFINLILPLTALHPPAGSHLTQSKKTSKQPTQASCTIFALPYTRKPESSSKATLWKSSLHVGHSPRRTACRALPPLGMP